MKIFIDTAKISEIEEAISWGIVDGVTTNPSLIKKAVSFYKEKGETFSMEEYIEKLLLVCGDRPVSLEVIGSDFESMVKEGRFLYERFNSINNNVVIKIPVSPSMKEGDGREFDGLKAIKKLSDDGIPVNATLIMTPNQALLAAKAGARYISPFAGRIDDYLRKSVGITFEKGDYFPGEGLSLNEILIEDDGVVSGVDLVARSVDIIETYGFDCEVIAASVRNRVQVIELLETGVHIATIPFHVLKDMIGHEKTLEGMKKFTEDVVPEYKELFR